MARRDEVQREVTRLLQGLTMEHVRGVARQVLDVSLTDGVIDLADPETTAQEWAQLTLSLALEALAASFRPTTTACRETALLLGALAIARSRTGQQEAGAPPASA
jgi:hypothetical protein